MKVKALALVLFFAFLISCGETLESPYSSPSPGKIATQVEFRIDMDTNVSNVMVRPPFVITAGIYVNNVYIGEITDSNVSNGDHTNKFITPSQSYQVSTWYKITFKFHNTTVPLEWQETIGFRMSVKLTAIDSDFEVFNDSITTGWFWGWKVGDWKEVAPVELGKFRVMRK